MNNVVVTTPEKLAEIVSLAVSNAIAIAIPRAVQKAKEKPYLTTDELMELTGWSRRTCQYMRDSRKIEFTQHGRRIMYPREGIDKFLEDHRIKVKKDV